MDEAPSKASVHEVPALRGGVIGNSCPRVCPVGASGTPPVLRSVVCSCLVAGVLAVPPDPRL